MKIFCLILAASFFSFSASAEPYEGMTEMDFPILQTPQNSHSGYVIEMKNMSAAEIFEAFTQSRLDSNNPSAIGEFDYITNNGNTFIRKQIHHWTKEDVSRLLELLENKSGTKAALKKIKDMDWLEEAAQEKEAPHFSSKEMDDLNKEVKYPVDIFIAFEKKVLDSKNHGDQMEFIESSPEYHEGYIYLNFHY